MQSSQNQKTKKVGCLTVILMFCVALVIVALIGALGREESPSDITTQVSGPYQATPESMTSLFSDNFDFDFSDLSCAIVAEEGKQVCTITYKNNEVAWDESAYVRQVFSTFIDFQRLAYNVDGIDAVRFEVWQDMTDDRGNTNSELCYQLMMDESTSGSYNWDSLSGLTILAQMQRDCSEFYVAFGIMSNVNPDDVIYHSLIF
nr:MAG TPA: hypothetical protein [Caudoviricetes sp.]